MDSARRGRTCRSFRRNQGGAEARQGRRLTGVKQRRDEGEEAACEEVMGGWLFAGSA